MRIAVIGNFDKELSNTANGGTELFTFSLANELALRAEITALDVYGVGQNHFTHPKITFISIVPTSTQEYIDNHLLLGPLSKSRTDFLSEVRFNIAIKIFNQLLRKHYDLIHDNSTSTIFNSLGQILNTPIVSTLHTNVISPSVIIPYSLGLIQARFGFQNYVTIAQHQKRFAEINNVTIRIIGNVYNGINLQGMTPLHEPAQKSYLFWIGRISRKHNKGMKEAVLASNQSAKPLTILTSIDDKDYYEKEIAPIITENVQLLPGKVDFATKMEYYRKARCLLYPIIWEEPFGLVFLEAMAAGTPVIAFARGAVPEIIRDGETGFIVNASNDDVRGNWITKQSGIAGLQEAIERLYSMSDAEYFKMSKQCRAHVENNFTIEKMADGYVKVYQQLAGR